MHHRYHHISQRLIIIATIILSSFSPATSSGVRLQTSIVRPTLQTQIVKSQFPAPATAATPEPPAGYLLRYDAANIDGSNNSTFNDMDPVTTWTNLGSTSSADATQSTSSAKPTYRNSGGVQWVDFDGGDYVSTTGTFASIAQPYTEIVVAGVDGLGVDSRFTDSNNLALRGGLYRGSVGNKLSLYAGSTVASTGGLTNLKYYFLFGYFDGNASKVVLTGVGSTGAGGTHARDSMRIGVNAPATGSFLDGRIREVLIYSGDMTADADLLAYLEAKYGTEPVDF